MNRAARHKSRNSIMEYYLTFKAIGRAILPSGSLIVNTILQRQRCRSLSFKSTFATRQANHFEDSLRVRRRGSFLAISLGQPPQIEGWLNAPL